MLKNNGVIKIWEEACKKIRSIIGDISFETWFSAGKIKLSPENTFVIEVPDKFFRDWLLGHYFEIIKDALSNSGFKGKVEIRTNPGILKKPQRRRLEEIESQFQSNQEGSLKLNPRYTFENFIVGNSNRFAHAAGLAVANSSGKTYNPLFIYGGVGLGKTHLLQAIAHKIKQNSPRANILYISSEDFTNQLIKAIQTHSTDRFRLKFRNLNVLLIDDVHFLGGKEFGQEELFHTFNVLYDNHRQVVLSSDRPPKEIPRMEERLVSRFNWGLVVDIQPPDFETRMAILKKKIEHESVNIPEEVLVFIAEKITSNIRELEGALIRVMAYSLIEEKPIDLSLTQEVLKDMLKEKRAVISIEKIQRVVGDFLGISVEDLKSKRRLKNLILPRQIAMFLCRKLTSLSLPEISKHFGKKDHTTVLHSIRKVEDLIKKDVKIKNLIEDIEQEIQKN